MIIAGIGSRETPEHILKEMGKVSLWLRLNEQWVRSGHAIGADWAFEQAAQENCITYHPWQGFNSHLKSRAHVRVMKPNCHTIRITKENHPAFDKLSYGALCLQCRNVNIILGEDLDSPVDAVICYTPDGKDSGGTGQAMRIAAKFNIPIINMYYMQDHLKVQTAIAEIDGTL